MTLKHLRIQNLILIESADISFENGLNVLTGETGSGKSAIMNSLSLIAGERADAGMVRRGADKAVVEALFEIDSAPQIKPLLEQAGIDHEAGEELLIRREISSAGKSRAFINNQSAQIGLLRQVSAYLFEIVGQHANQKLLDLGHHRNIVDLYGEMTADVAEFSKSWTMENAQRSQLETLICSEAQRLRDIDICHMELEELQSANLKENEDEDLFAEYTLLTNAEELTNKVQDVIQTLSGERQAVLPMLNRNKHALEQLQTIDPSLSETAKSFNSILIELQEISHTLRNYHSRIEHNPSRTMEVNERLSLIDRLKRRYGASIQEIQAYHAKTLEKLRSLENGDVQIEDLRKSLQQMEKLNNSLSHKLTEQRKSAAQKLEKAIVKELRALNMPKVEFHCAIETEKRSKTGDDRIEFYLSPNVGEHKIPVRDCASGGELSRLMLSLQALLAGKEQIPTLIFDEIDANIGGETATVVGEKLKAIGKRHQVLCITHFPQVAHHALHHLQISKKELKGRTVTEVKVLEAGNRETELSRMRGEGGHRE